MRYMRFARTLALESPHPQYKMAAVVVRGGCVISAAVNLHRQDRHAEKRALRPHLDCAGATIYVARRNGRCSKPCPDCMQTIIDAGVKNVVYVDEAGKTVKDRI